MDISQKSIEVFCCYARKDQPLLLELKSHLTPLQRKGLITLWADVNIDAGTEWEKEIHLHLNTAQIILLLVSPDFMTSEYCYGIEMQRALARHEQKEAVVIPIILRPVSWQGAPFGELQVLPTDASPVTSRKWYHQDEAFLDITEGVRRTAEKLLQKPSDNSLSPVPSSAPRLPIQRKTTRRAILLYAGIGILLIGGGGTALWIINEPTKKQPSPLTYYGHTGEVFSVAWSPNGTRIASGSGDRTVRIWDATHQGNALIVYQKHADMVFGVSWSPDNSKIASGSRDNTVRVWDAHNGGDLFVYRGHTFWVHSVAWSPNGTRIASASSDGTVQIWDAANGGTPLITCRGHTDRVYSVAWSPDGNRVASASLDSTVRVWDATHQGNALVVYRGHVGAQVNTVAWSPDGKYCVSGSWDFTAQVWDAIKGGEPLIVYRGHKNNVNSVTWSPDGKHIASGGADNTLQIWNAADGNPIVTYQSSYPISVAWSPDGKHIASGDHDTTVQEWQAI